MFQKKVVEKIKSMFNNFFFRKSSFFF